MAVTFTPAPRTYTAQRVSADRDLSTPYAVWAASASTPLDYLVDAVSDDEYTPTREDERVARLATQG